MKIVEEQNIAKQATEGNIFAYFKNCPHECELDWASKAN